MIPCQPPRRRVWAIWSAMVAGAATATTACAQEPARPTMTLGVQTHFAQDWPATRLGLARSAGAPLLRDSVPWARVETVAGHHDLTDERIAPLDKACREGARLLLVAVPLNPLHDGGGALRTAAARRAFADYLLALHGHFGSCLAAIEIGNEINAANSRQIYREEESGGAPLVAYVETVRTARAAFRERGLETRILGGSSNMIATGFLEQLFARGLLEAADGIAVHPYRSQADNLDVELANLGAAMRRHGRPLPVWASEFSDNFPAEEMAAPHLVKAATLLAAARVEAAVWYALVDQKWFRNMGLYSAQGEAKPALGAFRLTGRELLARGNPVRIDVGDPNVRLYRFGADGWVAWGASGTLTFGPGARLLDAGGRSIDGPLVTLGDEPVVALGGAAPAFARGSVIADSMLGYMTGDWRYLARRAGGSERELGWLDGQWTSHRGNRFMRPLRIGDVTGAPAGGGRQAASVIVRYVAPQARTVNLAACIDKKAAGDGVEVSIRHGGAVLASALVTTGRTFAVKDIALRAGDTIDLVVGPNRLPGDDGFRYRMRIAAAPQAVTAACPTRPATPQ